MQVTDVPVGRSRASVLPMLTWDMLAILLASAVLFLLVKPEFQFAAAGPLRLLLGFVYVMFFPGYCLTTVLFPLTSDLTRLERVSLSLGLSVSLVPVLGLALDRLPWGLNVWPIMIAELIAIVTFAVIGVCRRAVLVTEETSSSRIAWNPRDRWGALPPSSRRGFGLMLAATLIGVFSVAWVVFTPETGSHTTEFYILGENGLAEDFPRDAVVGQELSITLGTTNHEKTRTTYRVEVWVQDAWDASNRQQVLTIDSFILKPGQTQEVPLNWSMPIAGEDQRVDIQLFIDDRSEPYRNLRLFMNVFADTSN